MDTKSRQTTESVAIAAVEALPASSAPFPERGVYSRLFREGYRFGFFQAVRLLEQLFGSVPAPGETSSYRDGRIRFRPDTALVFPATDVKRIKRIEGGTVEVIAAFMGLYGIDSPLPYYFYDDLATEEKDTLAHRDFLDIFNHRLYAYFYRAWKKYRPMLHHRPGGQNAQSRQFLSLAGLANVKPRAPDKPPIPLTQLAALAGRLGPRSRNAEGLEAILRLLLDGIPVAITENVPCWVPIRARPELGQTGYAPRLGQDATIGAQVRDRSSKFRICLGPMGVKDYLALLPGGNRAGMVGWLVRTYTPDYLHFDIELHVRAAELPATQLGSETAMLGLTTSLGQPREGAVRRIVEYEP